MFEGSGHKEALGMARSTVYASPTPVSDSRAGIGKYFNLYNRRRPHSSLKRKTPDQVYYSQQPLTLAA